MPIHRGSGPRHHEQEPEQRGLEGGWRQRQLMIQLMSQIEDETKNPVRRPARPRKGGSAQPPPAGH
jgi:hypothetical protein